MDRRSSDIWPMIQVYCAGHNSRVNRLRPSIETVLGAVRTQLASDRLSDEEGRRLLGVLESIVRELRRQDTPPHQASKSALNVN